MPWYPNEVCSSGGIRWGSANNGTCGTGDIKGQWQQHQASRQRLPWISTSPWVDSQNCVRSLCQHTYLVLSFSSAVTASSLQWQAPGLLCELFMHEWLNAGVELFRQRSDFIRETVDHAPPLCLRKLHSKSSMLMWYTGKWLLLSLCWPLLLFMSKLRHCLPMQ